MRERNRETAERLREVPLEVARRTILAVLRRARTKPRSLRYFEGESAAAARAASSAARGASVPTYPHVEPAARDAPAESESHEAA